MVILLFNQLTKVFGVWLFLFLLLPSVTSADMERNRQFESKRMDINLNDSWKFHKGTQKCGERFSSVSFNDRNWEPVNLPHTWNANDGTDGGNDYYRGDSWYRRTFNLPTSLKGKSLYLQFVAAKLKFL